MNLRELKKRYLPEENSYYEYFYPLIFIFLILFFILILVGGIATRYFMLQRPSPVFIAVQKDGQKRQIYGAREPNLLPTTIIRFATTAAVRAYNFAPIGNDDTLRAVGPYFTDSGWDNYLAAVKPVINQVETNKLFAYGIVNGTPVISNQGVLPKLGYSWRVQIPFLVTFMSAEQKTQSNYMLTITVVRVPTYVNPQAIGIEEFNMVSLNAGL